jgi:hypothetical protein
MIEALQELGIQKITELANRMYDSGEIPEDMCKSVFIAIPKKTNASECEMFRTISLLSQITKIILRVLMTRARRKISEQISEEQYGFVADKGTRNAIFILRMLGERAVEMQQDLYLCFIDYQKAFDNVKHEELFEALGEIDLDGKDLRLLRNLYWKQTAAIRIDGELSRWIQIKKGTRQGCVISPDLYNLYSEGIMKKIEGMEGFKVGGVNMNNLRYADDTTLLANSRDKLQLLLDKAVEESEKLGLKVNEKKTFCMVISNKKKAPECKIYIHGREIKQVDQFSFLGSLMTSDGKSDQEIKRRIAIAKTAFQSMKNVLTSKRMSVRARCRILKCYIWSTLTYGCETWTISKASQEKLEAAEMWFLRRMMKIPWTDKVSNEEVLIRTDTERLLMRTIRKRQMEFFGHVIRKEALEQLVVGGKIEGKRSRGRPRVKYLESIRRNLKTDLTPNEIIHLASDRVRWRVVTADVGNDRAP